MNEEGPIHYRASSYLFYIYLGLCLLSMGYLARLLRNHLSMKVSTLWIYGSIFCSFTLGWFISLDTAVMMNKINCDLPVDRYSEKEILSFQPRHIKFMGLDFADDPWSVFDGKALSVYKISCLKTLNELYKAHQRQDQKLRIQIKMLAL